MPLNYKPLTFTTTLRNPERAKYFLKVIEKFEGKKLTNDLAIEIVVNCIKEKIYSVLDGEVVHIDRGTHYGTLLLNNLKNLILDFSGFELLTKEDVTIFTLKNCYNIKIIGLAIRHDRMGCFVNYFDIHTCENIPFKKCDINGYGFIGICINKSTGIWIKKCKIHECYMGVFILGK